VALAPAGALPLNRVSPLGVEDIAPALGPELEVRGDPTGKMFTHVAPIGDAAPDSLVWINPTRNDKQELLEATRAQLVVCDPSVRLTAGVRDKCLLAVPKPKLAFSAILRRFFAAPRPEGIHATAVVAPSAVLEEGVSIGAYSVVGAATIRAGTYVDAHVTIYDGVTIGRRCVIHTGCILGSFGFSFDRDDDGTLHYFPHLGGVEIGDDVEIQTMTNVDRGTLGDTVIGGGTKIDTGCHIGHNSVIGENTMIAARAMLGGSLKVGERCWLGPVTTYRDWLEIGDDAYIGLGSLVVKDVPAGGRYMGSPARPMDEYKELLAAMRALRAPPGRPS
jgi:UDP-3-O-[3-hydroxymyristoyl] glucosamine N-acyltransferase